MMRWVRRTVVELIVGASLGFGLWSFLGERITPFLFGSIGGSFTCKADVESALNHFIRGQLYSALGGAVLAVVGMILLRRWIAKAAAAQNQTTGSHAPS